MLWGAAEEWSRETQAIRAMLVWLEYLIQNTGCLGEEAGGWAWRILPRANLSTSGTNKRAISLISSTFCRHIINTVMAQVWGRVEIRYLPTQSEWSPKPYAYFASCFPHPPGHSRYWCQHHFPWWMNGPLIFFSSYSIHQHRRNTRPVSSDSAPGSTTKPQMFYKDSYLRDPWVAVSISQP